MNDFGRICRDDGSFMADYIRLDCLNIARVFGENDTLIGLPFSIPDEGTCINEC